MIKSYTPKRGGLCETYARQTLACWSECCFFLRGAGGGITETGTDVGIRMLKLVCVMWDLSLMFTGLCRCRHLLCHVLIKLFWWNLGEVNAVTVGSWRCIHLARLCLKVFLVYNQHSPNYFRNIRVRLDLSISRAVRLKMSHKLPSYINWKSNLWLMSP